MGMQGITELFHPWARKSFYWLAQTAKSFWKKSREEGPGTCRNSRVSESRRKTRFYYAECERIIQYDLPQLCDEKSMCDSLRQENCINKEVGRRMFSSNQMTKVKLVCALAWREYFAKGNNSVT